MPDSKAFLFVSRDFQELPNGGPIGGALYAGFLDGRAPKLIVENASNAVVVGKSLFFVRNGNLVVQAFDTRSLTASGTPFDIANDLEYRNGFDLGNFSVAGNTIAYVPATARRAQIGVFDTSGRLLDVKGQPADYSVLDVSPDGKSVAVSVADRSGSDVWILQLDRGVISRVSFNNTGWTAAFSPDGKRIATATLSKVSIRALDGSSVNDVLDNTNASASFGFGVDGWSADGKYLTDSFDVAYVDLQQRKLIHVLKTSGASNSGVLSPNGKWLAYMSR